LKISVVSIVYNCEEFLEKTWYSLERQTLKDFEWVVFNDGSIDGTKNFLLNLRDKRVRCINSNLNLGRGFARLSTLPHLEGQLICVWDVDDMHSDDRLSMAWESYSAGNQVTYSPVFVYDGTKRKLEGLREGKRFFGYEVPIHPSLNISKKLLLSYRYISIPTVGGIGEDMILLYSLALNCKIKKLSTPTTIYNETREISAKKTLHSNVGEVITLFYLLFAATLDLRGYFFCFILLLRTIAKILILKSLPGNYRIFFLLRFFRRKNRSLDSKTLSRYSSIYHQFERS
jgi:glycosyltransferase involved in cell wall biosynthesis